MTPTPETATDTSKAERWLTVAQAADYASLSSITVMRAARRQRLRGIKVNGARVWRFRREWVDQWLEVSLVGGQR
jgi:excisionase family DNA binding protein